jgi:hypothetical protein
MTAQSGMYFLFLQWPYVFELNEQQAAAFIHACQGVLYDFRQSLYGDIFKFSNP